MGALAQADGLVAVGALVPLGRLDGVQMKALEKAERLAVTTARGVLVADLPPEAAGGGLDELAGAGLAGGEGARGAGVRACGGRAGWAKSLADVRADAAAATRFVEGLPVPWVGCDRACGSPSGRHVRVEATGSGYAVTRRTRDGAVEPPGPAGAVEPPGLAGAVEPPGPAGAERPLGDAETALTASRSRAAGAQGCLDGAEPALTTSQERAAGAQGCLGGAETALITSPGRPGGGRDLGDVVAEAREP